MKNVFILCLSAILLACGGKKELSQNKDIEVIEPCSGPEYVSDSKHFRASAMGISNSQEIAKQKAMTSARSKLASSIQTKVKTVTDNYLSSYELNQAEEAKGRFQSITREISNQTLNEIKTICQKLMQGQDGKYKSYVTIEIGSDDIIKELNNKISNDDKLRIDYEYEKFKKVFEEEMKNISE